MYPFEKIFWTLACLVFIQTMTIGQASNDDCNQAVHISNPDSFCTGLTEFNNRGATPSAVPVPFCWGATDVTSDVWFSFAPTAPGAVIQLYGQSVEIPSGLDRPALAIYTGNCLNLDEVACQNPVSVGNNVRELTLTDLVIGQLYFIRIDGRGNSVGDFRLCLDVFVPVPLPDSDCGSAVILCDKSSFNVESLQGAGDDVTEVDDSCIQGESASSWYTWTCLESGTLEFTLTPNNQNNPEEDLDFAVYRLPNGINNCDDKELLRCMASGETVGQSADENAPCFGPTGLRASSTDVTENPGCEPGDDNFVAALNMVAGESYALVVNNFSESGQGFSIDWGGTGTFEGPVPGVEIEAVQEFECDKTIIFNDLSSSATDPIVAWTWNFGNGANQTIVDGQGPHSVIYESFGEKTIALTVESSKGCTVTEIVSLFVEACCTDTTTLSLSASSIDLVCAGVNTGVVTGLAMGGAGDNQFSIDGTTFQPSNEFNNLGEGEYSLIVQDKKGCLDTATTIIDSPPPFIVDAGADVTVDLGDSTDLDAVFEPMDTDVISIDWSPDSGLSCTNCLDPIAQAPGTTAYVITLESMQGCIARDTVVVFTNENRPIYIPNVMTSNRTLKNDFFRLFGGAAAEQITELRVYDRWGMEMYSGTNLPVRETKDANFGWDGTFRGQAVNPGLYVWTAKVRFIDGVEIQYKGDITVVR